MIVFSDTSPLTALMTIGRIEPLPNLFTEVFVPEAVHAELLRSHSMLPDWLQTRPFSGRSAVADFARTVDAGEAEAIALAKEMHADRLLSMNAKDAGWRRRKDSKSSDFWVSSCSRSARDSFPTPVI